MTWPNFEAWTMLAAMAQATKRIRIGCQVTGMIYRHPAECDAYGIALPPLRERFDRFDEGVEAIVGLLTQPSTTMLGQYVKLTDATCEPKPVQQPHPPITIGGRGPKRTLRAVARWAQQWNALVADPQDWLELKSVLAGHCEELGRDMNEITCSVNVSLAPDGDTEPVVAAATGFRDVGVDLVIVNLPHHAKPDSLLLLAEALSSLA